jgi:hypothetical protein
MLKSYVLRGFPVFLFVKKKIVARMSFLRIDYNVRIIEGMEKFKKRNATSLILLRVICYNNDIKV